MKRQSGAVSKKDSKRNGVYGGRKQRERENEI